MVLFMGLEVYWSDQWDKLAEHFYQHLEKNLRADPLKPECVVVNSSAMESWLRHYFVFDRAGRGSQRVLANWDVQQLYPFINDELDRMKNPARGRRNPRLHAYSRECLRWRLFGLFNAELLKQESFAELQHYCRDTDQNLSSRRRFELAGTLAKLYEDYQVYRPEMLDAWEHENDWGDLDPGWQKELWNALRAQDENSYLESFRQIEQKIKISSIPERYPRVTVFGVSVMPPVYLHFLQQLGEIIPVRLYTFNPCREQWDEDLSKKECLVRIGGTEDPREYLDVNAGNPLLTVLGKGCQSYLAEVVDRWGGQTDEQELFGADQQGNVLHRIQHDIRNRRTCSGGAKTGKPKIDAKDDSLQVHICHSPMREVEVLRDFVYRQFEEDSRLQPRDIQVLVSDLSTYAPYINAVFDTRDRKADATIPYAISDRTQMSASPTATAFMSLLNLSDSRFKASELFDLLETESVASAFQLDAQAMPQLRRWVRESGIRWGRDQPHLNELDLSVMEPTVTWQSGIDRMLLGYALGRQEGTTGSGLVDAGDAGELAPCEEIEGAGVKDLGQLLRFIDLARCAAEDFGVARTPSEWGGRLNQLLEEFFVSTNTTYADVAMVRSAVQDLPKTAAAAGIHEEVEVDVVRSFLQARLEETAPARDLFHNAVLFSPLQVMRSTPRRVICLLGLDDGIFPRRDRRASFDLIRQKMLRGDRSQRRDDRLAFLEALMSARERLYLSYVGRTDRRNEPMPPSTVISDLKDYLDMAYELPSGRKSRDGQDLLFCETLHHLQAFHPDYFSEEHEPRLYSYSGTNCKAARRLAGKQDEGEGAAPDSANGGMGPAVNPDGTDLPLEMLKRFMLNPAKEFHRHVLQVNFKDFSDLGLADAELFTVDPGLGTYGLTQSVIEAQLAGMERGVTQKQLIQQGKAPLGMPGEADFKDWWEAINLFLTAEFEEGLFGQSISLKTLKELEQSAVEREFTVRVCERRITGRLRIFNLHNRPWVLIFRPSSIKTKDRLRGWLTHLFATIVAEEQLDSDQPLGTLLVGKHKDVVPEVVKLNSGADSNEPGTVQTRTKLEGFVTLYEEWQEAGRLMPFAPETSEAYVHRLLKEPRDDPGERALAERMALDAAGKKWWPDGVTFSEGKDRDFYQAFGEAGPMGGTREEDFKELALKVHTLMKGAFDVGAE